MKLTEASVIASLCRESFFDFFQEFWEIVVPEPLELNWHIEELCNIAQEHAERVFQGLPKLHDTVVNISPGTSKSSLFSIMYPAWVWTRMPTARFIGASYSFPLAMDLSRKNRDVVLSDKYRACFPEVKLREDQNTKHYFANTTGGYRYAVGVNGTVTGMHGHFIIIDDPLDPQEALSRADLDSTNHWLNEVITSRKVSKVLTPTILIMQRLAIEDPTAIFLERSNVEHVCLPAELTDNVRPVELREKYVDGLMDPRRMPKEVLNEYKEKGDYYYSGQFLQLPIPLGGGMFKTDQLKYVNLHEVPADLKAVVRNWDKAGTLDDGSWTVGAKLGMAHDGRIFVLDVERFQLESYAREKRLKACAIRDGLKVMIGLEQEPGSGGKESAEATVRKLLGWRVKVHKPSKGDGSKAERADPFAYQVNAGNVYLVRAKWNKAYVRELTNFPMSKLTDQVDGSSGAFSLLWRGRIRIGGMKKHKAA